jgi:hypothetical protein
VGCATLPGQFAVDPAFLRTTSATGGLASGIGKLMSPSAANVSATPEKAYAPRSVPPLASTSGSVPPGPAGARAVLAA